MVWASLLPAQTRILTITVSGAGTVEREPAGTQSLIPSPSANTTKWEYPEGTDVRLRGFPAEGYEFWTWQLPGFRWVEQADLMLRMDENMEVQAQFAVPLSGAAVEAPQLEWGSGGDYRGPNSSQYANPYHGAWSVMQTGGYAGVSYLSTNQLNPAGSYYFSWVRAKVPGPGSLEFRYRCLRKRATDGGLQVSVNGQTQHNLYPFELGEWYLWRIPLDLELNHVTWMVSNRGGLFTPPCDLDAVAVYPDTGYVINRMPKKGGMISLEPDRVAYSEGEVVRVRAEAEPGYGLASWLKGLSGFANPGSLKVTGHTVIEPDFAPVLSGAAVDCEQIVWRQTEALRWTKDDTFGLTQGNSFASPTFSGLQPWDSGLVLTLSGPGEFSFAFHSQASSSRNLYVVSSRSTTIYPALELGTARQWLRSPDYRLPAGESTINLNLSLYTSKEPAGTYHLDEFRYRPDALAREATFSSGDWLSSPWYGDCMVASYPWIFHLEHGWQYCLDDAGANAYFYDWILGRWWWTNSIIYPFFYYFGESSGWVYYWRSSGPNLRFFYDYREGNEGWHTDL